MDADPTTLQLARRIADAVAIALKPRGMAPNRDPDDAQDAPTQAVLRVLFETGSWFCRFEHGGPDDPPEPDTPPPDQHQGDLFT